ncbi:MAG: sensor histidine kinase [Kofleriaceae bacterium]
MVRSPPRRRRLALRVYAFAAVLSVAIMVALLTLPRYMRRPSYLEPQAALMQFLVERISTKDPVEFAASTTRLESRLRGRLTLFDEHGTVLRTTVTPPLPVPTREELATLRHEKWSLDVGRIVVRSDDGTMVGVYAPNRQGFPWSIVLPMGAAILVCVGAASVWFSRRLVHPLDQLARAARQFGTGDTTARARLDRHDELGDLGAVFDDMADRTAAVLSAQRQLMGDVSHELRTPLARIRVALELAAEDPVAAKDVLADVGADLDEIDQLIDDILTTARLHGDSVNIDRRPMQLGELATRAVDRFTARHPGRVLQHTIDDSERAIECDPVLLRRALDNLLDNAAKYSEPAAPVSFVVHPNASSIAFEITDRGIGMSPDELERAFTPFWRADQSRTRTTGGVGLGLALARRIARAHGGDVTLSSAPGQGTIARLSLPQAGIS